MTYVNLYEAKTTLSKLVDWVAEGEEVVIGKNGVPMARLVPVARRAGPRCPANALGVTFIADDFDRTDPETLALFNDPA